MNILIDIGHPAHYHYFKNFAAQSRDKGHSIFFVARNKGIIHELLTEDGWDFLDRGKGRKGFLGKIWYLFITDIKLWKYSRKHKIDLSIGFPSTYAAHASFLRRKPHIAFNDTEHASFERHLYPRFSHRIITPFYYKRKINKKQQFFNGFMEQAYLEPGSFQPNPEIVAKYAGNEPFVMLRFISWEASHDWGIAGLTLEKKREIIQRIQQKDRNVIVSSEIGESFSDLNIIQVPNTAFHQFLNAADLVISEGGTTSNEAALLGTPTILINPLLAPNTKPGVHDELEANGLQMCFEKLPTDINQLIESMLDDSYRQKTRAKAKEYLSTKESPTTVLNKILKEYE